MREKNTNQRIWEGSKKYTQLMISKRWQNTNSS